MTFKRAFPPKRLPSRRASSAVSTPPQVPTHRAPSSQNGGLSTPSSKRFCVKTFAPSESLLTPQSQQRQEEERKRQYGAIVPYCPPCDKQLFNSEDLSPQPKSPQNDIVNDALKTGSSLTPEPNEAQSSLRRHFYCSTEKEDSDEQSTKLVGYSIYNSLTVKAVVHATPSQRRFKAGLLTSPVELHIHAMDANTYPMRRLLRLIHRKLPYTQNENDIHTPSKYQTIKGYLYMYKEDNEHLHFLPGMPSIILLNGPTVLADVFDLAQMPLQGAVVQFRWVEDYTQDQKVILSARAETILDSTQNNDVDESTANTPEPNPSNPWRQETHQYDGNKWGQYRRNVNNSNRMFLPSEGRSCSNNNDSCCCSNYGEEGRLKVSHITVNGTCSFVPFISYVKSPRQHVNYA